MDSLERQMSARIDAEVDLLREEFEAEGLPDLVREIHERADYFPALSYLVTDAEGKRLAGNLLRCPLMSAGPTLRLNPPRAVLSNKPFVCARSCWAREFALAVADDLDPIEEIQQAFLSALGWGLAAFVILSLAGGILLSRAFLQRVDVITRTAEAIIGGDLHSRIPLRGTDDNLDRLSSTLNRMLDRIGDLMEA